ncbi:response regulator receiver protein [Geobacter metallireducens RCH3]|nr:response regulator receiver protein [Geobacter metallireducens RCH3]
MAEQAKKRILVVDDEENARIGLSKLLEREGFEVESVSNGYEALNYLNQRQVNVIVTDINMPEMNGITFL